MKIYHPSKRKSTTVETILMSGFSLNHLTEKSVDLVLTVAKVTTLNKVGSLLAPAAGRGVQLEGPEEVTGILEVGSDSENLMNKVLNANNVELAQLRLDEVVGGDRGATTVNLFLYECSKFWISSILVLLNRKYFCFDRGSNQGYLQSVL